MFGEHEELLKQKIRTGELVLVLGAGANVGSTNRRNEQIVFGEQLAEKLAISASMEYHGEDLSEVSSAVSHVMGKDKINQILIDQFRYCNPSQSLNDLFSFTWKRVYTWNYDDALIEACKKSEQRIHSYNGLKDAVENIDQRANLQCVYLHGMITRLQDGIILSRQEYAQALQSSSHEWYKELAADYRAETIVFIGSSLDEPILEAEISRASRPENQYGGFAFLITPDNLTPIKKSSLQSRKIIHIRSTLSDFVTWIKTSIGQKISPKDIIKDTKFFTEDNISLFTHDDIEVAHNIRPINAQKLKISLSDERNPQFEKTGRSFLQGFPVTWQIAASSIPVKLKQTERLEADILNATEDHHPMFVAIGQAGSGKSTATMQCLLNIQDRGGVDIFELDGAVTSVQKAINVLKRISSNPKIFFLRNLFVFGNQISDVFAEARSANITFVTTARSGEWHEHFKRHFEGNCKIFQFERFRTDDYQPLIERLERFVPAPSFRKLKRDQKIERLRKSKNQLLIALREATESRNFDEIIIDEFRSLENSDVQELFVIVGLCTLARVGVSPQQAAEAYELGRRTVPFRDALNRLTGIVEPGPTGRLVARHEFYVRNILDTQVDIETILKCLKNMLKVFTKFQIPITKHVGRNDAALFRFLLNHSVIRERSEKVGDKNRGVEVYEEFELEFQLDGHFWLQFGLYYQRLGKNLEAMQMFEKSIQAFPGNPFAVHALAAERLRQAAGRNRFDHETKFLINSAVRDLEKLDATEQLFFDQYPLVTLSRDHVHALFEHGQIDQARGLAREYFERLTILEKKQSTEEITQEKIRLLTFLSTGIWNRPGY